MRPPPIRIQSAAGGPPSGLRLSLVEWVSKGMTLLPGSIIAPGTPDGVGFARTPAEFLRPGDGMETEVERTGILRSSIVAAGPRLGARTSEPRRVG